MVLKGHKGIKGFKVLQADHKDFKVDKDFKVLPELLVPKVSKVVLDL
jgi:hypothetical protein